MKLTTQLIVALSVVVLAAAIFYCAITLTQHNSILTCQSKLIAQALNEAFHHARLNPPPNCAPSP